MPVIRGVFCTVLGLATGMLFAGAVLAETPSRTCPPVESGMEPFAFTGLFPAIESRMALSNFRKGMIVEIDPRTMPKPAAIEHVKELQALGARVSIYLVGGHCDLGRDCRSLGPDAVLETTGSYNWDRSERRIINILSRASRRRLEAGIESGWRIGANYIRIDNLHWPAGSGHPRDAGIMKAIIDWGHDIEDRLRASGAIPADRPTGLVAHNNLLVWKELIEAGGIRRLPAFLTSERSAQLYPARTDAAGRRLYEGDLKLQTGRLSPQELVEIKAGGLLAEAYGIPYSVVEFARSHNLAARSGFYSLDERFVQDLARMPGVSEVIVMPNESQYVGRARVIDGNGPRVLRSPAPIEGPGRTTPCAVPQR